MQGTLLNYIIFSVVSAEVVFSSVFLLSVLLKYDFFPEIACMMQLWTIDKILSLSQFVMNRSDSDLALIFQW